MSRICPELRYREMTRAAGDVEDVRVGSGIDRSASLRRLLRAGP